MNLQQYSQETHAQQDLEPIYSKIEDDLFHIQNGSLWIKWHSLISWHDQLSAHQNNDDFLSELEYLFFQLTHFIVRFFKIELSRSKLEQFSIKKPNSKEIIKHSLNPHYDVQLMNHSLVKNGFFIEPISSTIMISETKIHRFLEAVGQNIFCKINPSTSEGYYYRCLKIFFGKAIHKILDPHQTHSRIKKQTNLRSSATLNPKKQGSLNFTQIANNQHFDHISFQRSTYDLFDQFIASKTSQQLILILKNFCQNQNLSNETLLKNILDTKI